MSPFASVLPLPPPTPGRAHKVKNMAAAVLLKPRTFEIREVPIPRPGPGEIRVKLEGCGVCASNLPPWEGKPWFRYPFLPGALGHEAWGRVDALGSEVAGLAQGDRVGILSYNAYAEYDLAKRENVVRLPESLDAEPFPAEPLGCAVNVFRRSFIDKGDTVAIVGIGFLGALLTQLATLAEARVIAISHKPHALRFARRFGAAQTVAVHDLKDLDDRRRIVEAVKEATGGALCDIALEATGRQEPLDLAAELTRDRGRLVIAGNHYDGPRQIDMPLWTRRGLDAINAHESSPPVYLEGMREAVGAVDAGLLTPGPLYTHRFPLERLGDALDLAARRREGFMKALICF